MTNKIISSVILTTCIFFFALANANPDNILFLFLSSNPLIGFSRIVLAAGMVVLSFKNVLYNPQVRQAAKYLGLGLIAFGGLSMIITPLGSAVYNYAKLLDWMIIAEAGVIFTSCAITIPQKLAKKTTSRTKSAKLQHTTA
jgi:hypothetical protein